MESAPKENLLEEWRLKKRRRIRYVIIACVALIPLFAFLEKKVVNVGVVSFPVSGNVLAFVLININVILLLLMVFLVLRSLVELVFDRRRKILGTKLRTKMVISFVSLSLIPTSLLFFIALQFVSTSMDYWFNINVDQSLEESLRLAQEVYADTKASVGAKGRLIGDEFKSSGVRPGALSAATLEQIRLRYDVDELALISAKHALLWRKSSGVLGKSPFTPPEDDLLGRALAGEGELTYSIEFADGELIRALTPLTARGRHYILLTGRVIPAERLARMSVISKGIDGYRQLLLMKQPIKTSLLVMLLIVTLLIIFSAIWFAFYVADGLTKPMNKLAEGIGRVAGGELDFVLERESGDEMGALVDSFNRMIEDLRVSKQEVDAANQALKASNLEIDNRRRYTEIILQNVTAGVISLDREGRILTINNFAEDLLKIKGRDILNKDYRLVVRYAHLTILEQFFAELEESGKSSIQRPLRITVAGETLSLIVNFTKLEDEEGRQIGLVIVFDNLTELEKVQRMAAWREVARRIAHEVKNPLTPIQLSAQRLRRKYLGVLEEDEVFDSCTKTIINQVDGLKRLVSEFSSFARMPAVKKSQNNALDMVKEVLVLYEQAHKEVEFRLEEGEVEESTFDAEQLKRVLVNLLDNAVAALAGPGVVELAVYTQPQEGRIFIEVRDNGPGVPDSDKMRLFEPYFSTKKSGTGLGLAIASTVVADHGGYIRVKDNTPRGARFIIELPI